MSPIKISPRSIERHYEALDAVGAVPAGGFYRPGYSAAESAAHCYVEEAAIEAGLMVRRDAAGNLIVETPGNYSEWIETGSHMDTVPGGGNFDGLSGVVAGLEAICSVLDSATKLQRGLRLRAWRAEESATFGIASIGSRAAFGMLPADSLQRMNEGCSLAECMRVQGADPDVVQHGEPALSEAERAGIAAYIELHIEQGCVLEREDADVGIVTGIRGSERAWVKIRGAFDHSGTTPMGEARCDANLAMAYILVEIDKMAMEAVRAGEDIVQTTGVINSDDGMNEANPETHDNAVSKVSGFAYFSHEVRGCNPAVVRHFAERVHERMRKVAKEFGVEIEIETFALLPGIATLDSKLQALLETCSRDVGVSSMWLPSGAWHDAGVLHGAGIPVAMLFVPSRGGVSHSPEEFTSHEQIATGATVLAHALLKLAG